MYNPRRNQDGQQDYPQEYPDRIQSYGNRPQYDRYGRLYDPEIHAEDVDELYNGYPVSSGAGIVNDPSLKRNDLIANALMLEQLKNQGFDAPWPVVDPTKLAPVGPVITDLDQSSLDPQLEELRGVVSDDTIAKLYEKKKIESENYNEGGEMFPPMPGYYTSYYANMAIIVPENYYINRPKTTNAWKNAPTPWQLRYVVLAQKVVSEYLGGVPFLGESIKDTEALTEIYYAMQGNMAFQNELQAAAIKKPFKWKYINNKDVTGYNQKGGVMNPNTKYNLNRPDKDTKKDFSVLQGHGDSVTTMEEEPVDTWSNVLGSWGNLNLGKIGEQLSKTFTDALNETFKQILQPSKKKKRYRLPWEKK